ncbi:flagellar motor protein MotB, partial [Bacteriovoracaceae bacterium]|nr:flagellar motor protein MotB [Bacteriovoracaceae bacterium]
MADENAEAGGGGGDDAPAAPQKCPVCVPGLPGWMATFSDLVTLLLTFFVLLLSFAKTESAKYEAALGSIRNAFGGNVLKQGEVIQKGKSPDNSPTMLESQEPVRPFPIDFLTMEGILDKHEINRESDEELSDMRDDLNKYDLSDNVDVYEMPEGIKVVVKDTIYFKEGDVVPRDISIEVYSRLVKLLSNEDWVIFVMGHSSRGERSLDGKLDSYELSARRSLEVAKSLITRGVRPEKVTPISYGDTRPNMIKGNRPSANPIENRRVEFVLRK